MVEDKLLQLAVARILEAIYEEDFLRWSYGYRPKVGAHDAVEKLTVKLQFGRYEWAVEADIKGKPSPKRVALETVEKVLRLYRQEYADHNVRHFHQKLVSEHGIGLSYSWVKAALQGAGLVQKAKVRKAHRQRRPRRPLPGMMLHIDASRHQWFQDERWYELLTVLDDATSQIYYAQLVEEESTRTVMAALREVIEGHGLCCSLYSDRASHFWVTSRAGGGVDSERLTQVGRALKQLGIRLIPAYSPQARGRMERKAGMESCDI